MNFKIGQYVQVTRRPMDWEGAGESNQDRIDLIGHIGVVASVWDDSIFVRFPTLDDEGPTAQRNAQRNIEMEALEIVSSPAHPLPQSLLDNCN